jgi:hypothetical protein
MRIGVAELWVLLTIAAICLVPIAAAVWALVTLHRIRAGQDAIRRRLDSIERLLQRTPTAEQSAKFAAAFLLFQMQQR